MFPFDFGEVLIIVKSAHAWLSESFRGSFGSSCLLLCCFHFMLSFSISVIPRFYFALSFFLTVPGRVYYKLVFVTLLLEEMCVGLNSLHKFCSENY